MRVTYLQMPLFLKNLLCKVSTSVSLNKHTVLQKIEPWLFISVAAENTKTELGCFDLYLLPSSESNPSKLVRGKIAKSYFYFSFLLQMICWWVAGFLFFVFSQSDCLKENYPEIKIDTQWPRGNLSQGNHTSP